jgi:hypothetical protein
VELARAGAVTLNVIVKNNKAIDAFLIALSDKPIAPQHVCARTQYSANDASCGNVESLARFLNLVSDRLPLINQTLYRCDRPPPSGRLHGPVFRVSRACQRNQRFLSFCHDAAAAPHADTAKGHRFQSGSSPRRDAARMDGRRRGERHAGRRIGYDRGHLPRHDRSGWRSVRLTLAPSPQVPPGEDDVRLRVKRAGSATATTDATRVALAAAPNATATVLLRRGPTTGNRDVPTADLSFRRGDLLNVAKSWSDSGKV